MATEQSVASWFWELNNNKINIASEKNVVNTDTE